MSGLGSFSDLKRYVELDDLGRRRDDLVAAWSRGVANHETADLEMSRTAALNTRRKGAGDPVYHLLRSIGAEGHQAFSALHYDADTDRYHMHVGVNMV